MFLSLFKQERKELMMRKSINKLSLLAWRRLSLAGSTSVRCFLMPTLNARNSLKACPFRSMKRRFWGGRYEMIWVVSSDTFCSSPLQLQRISSVDSEPQSGAWRWLDFFFWIYAAFQIITVVIYWVACDFSDNPNDPLNLGYPER